MSFSILENNKSRFLGLLQEINATSPSPKGYMLILDEESTKIISAHFKLSQLLEQNILSIEKLELQRKPFQKMQAIYFLSPQEDKINILIDDFEKDNKYKYAHIIFTNQLQQNLLESISQKKLVTFAKSLKEFNLDYLARDDNCFSLQIQNPLNDYLNKEFIKSKQCAQKLFTLIPSLQKYYEFEIIYNTNSFNISQTIAEQLKDRLDAHLKYLQDNNNEILDKQSGKVTVLILDRSVDIQSTIIHDFHYQPLLYDLNNIQNDMIEVKEKNEIKKINISQNELFQQYKYEHIADALQGIPQDMQKYMNENNAAKLQQGQLKNIDLKDMNSIITQMPLYQQTINGFQININQMQNCLNMIEQQGLKSITELEYCLTTGVDSKGQSLKDKEIFDKVLQKLNEIKNEDLKKRLVIIAILNFNLNDENRKKLTDTLQDQKLILNLSYLGVNLQSSNSKLQLKVDEVTKKQAKDIMNASSLELNRYVPYTYQIVEKVADCIQQKKSFDVTSLKTFFKSININQRQVTAQQKKGGLIGKLISSDDKANEAQQKLIVFVAGGISYCEIRVIKQKMKKYDVQVIVGGSQVLTQQDMMKQIQDL